MRLSDQQLDTLRKIKASPGCSVSSLRGRRLSRRYAMNHSSHIARLEKNGLIRREYGAKYNAHQLYLTELGEAYVT